MKMSLIKTGYCMLAASALVLPAYSMAADEAAALKDCLRALEKKLEDMRTRGRGLAPFFWRLLILAASVTFIAPLAEAVPSFARQTGQACTQCHVQAHAPDLTPFGREFKLNGYVWGGKQKIPPISAMIQGSFTHTNKGQPGGAGEGDFGPNDNLALDEAALLYAGRILPKFGAFVHLTYDGIEDKLELETTDIRLANQATVGGYGIVYGVSFNNAPTAQDLWNTTPFWGFPFVQSSLAPVPAATPLIDNTFNGQVGGASAYLMWNRLLYLEAGAYTMLAKGTQQALGTFEQEQNRIDGGAPYWRVALQHEWKGQYVSIGHFGLRANVFPERNESAGSNQFTDLGADATYQFLGTRRHIFELKGSYIREDQDLKASQALELSNNLSNTLNTFRINGAYTFAQTYGLTFGYFKTWGSTDTGLYQPEPITGSASGSPDSEGFIVELDYIPFGKAGSFLAPWLNLRLALQYTAYTEFNGGSSNYDGFGRDADDNNTLYLNGWLAF